MLTREELDNLIESELFRDIKKSRDYIEDKFLNKIISNDKGFEKICDLLYIGDPRPSPRPRSSKGRMYDPGSKDKKLQREVYKEQLKKLDLLKELEGYFVFNIDLYVAMPLSIKNSDIKRYSAEKKVILPNKKPDLDNYAKLTLDALNGLLYKDDGHIIHTNLKKFYSVVPRIEIEVYYNNIDNISFR